MENKVLLEIMAKGDCFYRNFFIEILALLYVLVGMRNILKMIMWISWNVI